MMTRKRDLTRNGSHHGNGSPHGQSNASLSVGKEDFHLALLGEVGVGKSALTVKYITKRYINEYDPTLEGTYKKMDQIDAQEVIVHLMDTYDKEGRNPDRYLKWSDAFVVVYSITCRSSFERARAYLDTLANYHRITSKDKPIVLVGNKMDLERYRQVSKSEGSSLAAQHECAFYETSAAEEFTIVQHVFHAAVRDIIRERVRQMPLQPLIILEDDNPKHASPAKPQNEKTSSLPRISSNRNGLTQKLTRATEKTDKPKGNFKFFNRGFKIFNSN